jgi:hypothetical protein
MKTKKYSYLKLNVEIKGKVKSVLFLIMVHTMNTYGGGEI